MPKSFEEVEALPIIHVKSLRGLIVKSRTSSLEGEVEPGMIFPARRLSPEKLLIAATIHGELFESEVDAEHFVDAE